MINQSTVVYRRQLARELMRLGIATPRSDDPEFPRFVERLGYCSVEPARMDKLNGMIARYAARAAAQLLALEQAHLPDARVLAFPAILETMAEIVTLDNLRQRRKEREAALPVSQTAEVAASDVGVCRPRPRTGRGGQAQS